MELEDKLKFGKEVEPLPELDLEVIELEDPYNDEDIVISRSEKAAALYQLGNVTGSQARITIGADNLCKLFYMHNQFGGDLNVSLKETDTVTFEIADGSSLRIKPNGTIIVLQSYRVDAGGGLFVSNYKVTGDLVESTPAGPRPEKRIPNTTQYTAIAEDATKYLVFDYPVEFIIPSGVFAKNDELEGDCEGGDVAVTGSGVTILKLETQRAIVLNNGPFGMRFKSGTKATLMGALKPL